jgi:hypothetical protein
MEKGRGMVFQFSNNMQLYRHWIIIYQTRAKYSQSITGPCTNFGRHQIK